MPRHVDVDKHPRDREWLHGHRFGCDGSIDRVQRDEPIENIEVGLGAPVEFDNAPALNADTRLGIVRTANEDQTGVGPFPNEAVAVDFAAGTALDTAGVRHAASQFYWMKPVGSGERHIQHACVYS